MVTMLRSTSILLAVIAALTASSFPAAAQLSKLMGEKWAKNCLTETAKSSYREALKRAPLGSTSVGEATLACCRRERTSDSACKDLEKDQGGRANCQLGEETCRTIVKADPSLKADIEKAEKEKAEKAEKEKAAANAPANCKGVRVNDFSMAVCCAASNGTGCVRNAEDCKLLNGTEKTSAEAACNKGFPGYTGRVARAPEIDCSTIKSDAVWTAEKGFKQLGDGKCSIRYDCGAKSPESSSALIAKNLCKPVPSPVLYLSTGTCTDAKCSDCKAAPPAEKCTVSYAKK